MEPYNIKAVLATDFKSYSVGEDRKKGLRPILGDGIFNSDGAAWQHSRELLRPCFVRSQLGDIDLFEKHFRHLLHHIPRDGSTMDLQSLFFDLTMDIATEFLFGESTNSLVPDKRRPEDDRFVEAFTYVQNTLDAKAGILTLFLPDRRFNRSCKYVHGKLLSFSLMGVFWPPTPSSFGSPAQHQDGITTVNGQRPGASSLAGGGAHLYRHSR
ncbi:MAG: hypothetical protein Q9183_003630 [Haloplaca sp. 2 TL-2023]